MDDAEGGLLYMASCWKCHRRFDGISLAGPLRRAQLHVWPPWRRRHRVTIYTKSPGFEGAIFQPLVDLSRTDVEFRPGARTEPVPHICEWLRLRKDLKPSPGRSFAWECVVCHDVWAS
jgi:hypothetical protein